MCGIAGTVSRRGRVDMRRIGAAVRALKHRGPDGRGVWCAPDGRVAFGHVRLAIVDLDDRSAQPLSIDKGAYVITFNGEIYNYRELREELREHHAFTTTSDTEVLLAAYKVYGHRMLERIEGMFAFAIADRVRGEVFIARDRFGQKPLVYTEEGGFSFASEIPALLALQPAAVHPIDSDAIKIFLTPNFNHIPAPYTAFKKIRKLLAGHYLVVRSGSIVENKQYYRLRKQRVQTAVCEPFASTMRSMLPEEVGFATLLSGGNDSALVAAALSDASEESVDSYTLRIGRNDVDAARAQTVAKTLRSRQTEIPFAPGSLADADHLIGVLGEPYFHTTSLYLNRILKQVRKRHKVLFSGSGADEVYNGYDNRFFIGLHLALEAQRHFPSWIVPTGKYPFVKGADIRTFKQRYYEDGFAKVAAILVDSSLPRKAFDVIGRLPFKHAEITSAIDLSYMSGLFIENAHSIQLQADLVGMAHSIEIRTPFLERAVVEHGYGLGVFEKVLITRPSEGKKPVKLCLLRKFPRSFVYGRKIGFGVALDARSIIEADSEKIIKGIRAAQQTELFDAVAIEEFIESVRSGSFDPQLAMKLYAIGTWCRFISARRK